MSRIIPKSLRNIRIIKQLWNTPRSHYVTAHGVLDVDLIHERGERYEEPGIVVARVEYVAGGILCALSWFYKGLGGRGGGGPGGVGPVCVLVRTGLVVYST